MIMIRVIMMEVIVVVVMTILNPNEEPVLHSRGFAARPCGWYKVCGGGGHRLFDGIWMKKR